MDSAPPAANVVFKPLITTEQVTYLSGRVGVNRSPLGGYEVTIEPPDKYLVPLATKIALEDAFESGMPVHLVETYRRPGEVNIWPACILIRAEFTEAPGTDREEYTYKITLITGV